MPKIVGARLISWYPEPQSWPHIGAAKPFPFRVAHASRVLVAASRRNELFAPRRVGRAESKLRVKFAAAGRLGQQPGRLRYPDQGTPPALNFGVRGHSQSCGYRRWADSSTDEELAQVPLVEILGYVAADDLLVLFEQVEVAISLFRRELEGNVEKLPEA